ncbi:MAG: hypothetical protein AAB037_00320 [Chloroflexota bacterium]
MGGIETKKVDSKKKLSKQWAKPEVADVTGRIMAQPFIRFT